MFYHLRRRLVIHLQMWGQNVTKFRNSQLIITLKEKRASQFHVIFVRFCSRHKLSCKKLLFVTKLLTIHLRRLKSGNYAGQRNGQIKATNTNVLSTALLACEYDKGMQTVRLGVTNNLRWGTV